MAVIKKLNGSGWSELSDSVVTALKKRGIHMDIMGLEGVGKSSVALSLAHLGRIAYINIDHSVDRARYPEGKSKKNVAIHTVQYSVSHGENQMKASCMPAWDEADKKMHAAADWAVGVVVDTADEDWELLRLGAFGTVTPKGRTDRLYGPVNAKFRNHLRDVTRVHKKHLVTITKLKDEYKDVVNRQTGAKDSIKTGKHVPVGFRELGYMADVRIRVNRKGDEFSGLIEVCKLAPLGPSLEGMEIEGENLDFASIVALATETEREEWL